MEFCNTEECEIQRRSQTMKRRVSFSDTFQVVELHTGNIYDVPGINDDSNCQILLQQEHGQNADVNASNKADQSKSLNVSRKHKMEDTDEPIAKKKTNLFLSSTGSKNTKKTLNFRRKKKNISDSDEKENIIPEIFEVKESDDMELTIFPCSSDVNTTFLDDDMVFQDEKNVLSDVTDKTCHFVSEVMELTCNSEYPLKQTYSDTFEAVPGKNEKNVHSDVTDKTCHFVSEVMELTCNSEYPLKQTYSDTFKAVPGKNFVNSSTAHSSTVEMPKYDWQPLEETFLKSSSKNVSTNLNFNLCHQVKNTDEMFTLGTGSHNELKNKNTDIYSNKENFKPFSFASKCDLKYLTISTQEYYKRMDRNATLNLEHISAFKLSNLDSNQTGIIEKNDRNTDYLTSDLMELTCNFKNSLKESSVMYDSVENIASESSSINMESTCASASSLNELAEEPLHKSFNQTAKNADLGKNSLHSSNHLNVICNIDDKYVPLNSNKGFLFDGKSCIKSKKSFDRMITKESPRFEPHISRIENLMQSQENENDLVKNPTVMSRLKAINSSALSLDTSTDEIQQSSKNFSYDINDKNTHYFTSNMMDLTHNTEASFKQSPTGIKNYLKNMISASSLQCSKHLCASSNFTGSPVQELQKTGIESFCSNFNLSARNGDQKLMINNSEIHSQIPFVPVYDIKTQPTALNSNKNIFDLDADISTELKKTAYYVSLKEQSDSVPDISGVSMRCSMESKGNEEAGKVNGSMVSNSKFVKLLGIDSNCSHISNTKEKSDISVHVNNSDKNTLYFTSNPMELTCNSENSVEEFSTCYGTLEAINSKESFNVTKEQNKHLSINPNKAMLFCNSNNTKFVKSSDINIQNETLKTDLDSRSKCHKKQSDETTDVMLNMKLLPADTSFNASNKNTCYFTSEFVDLTCNFKNLSEHSAVNHRDNTQDNTSSRKSYQSEHSAVNHHDNTQDNGIVDKNTCYFSSDPMAMTCNSENLAEHLDASEYSIQNISSEKSNKSICLSHNSFSNDLPVAETRRVSPNSRVSLKDCSDFISKHTEPKSETTLQNYNLNGQISNAQCMDQSNQAKISDEKLEYVENSAVGIKNSDVKIREENSFQQLSSYDNFKNVSLKTDRFTSDKSVTPIAKNYSEKFQMFATHSRQKRSYSPCNKNRSILKPEVSCNHFEESNNSIDLHAGSSLSGALVPEIPETEKSTKRIRYTFTQNENIKSKTINENSNCYETQLDEVFNLKDNNLLIHSNNKIFPCEVKNDNGFTEACDTILKEKCKTASDLAPLQHKQSSVINANAIHNFKHAEIPDRLSLDVEVRGHDISLSLHTMNEELPAEEYSSNCIRNISKTSISDIPNNQVLYKCNKNSYNLPLYIRLKRDSIQKETLSDENLSLSSNIPNLTRLESRFLKPINPLQTGILYTIKKMKNYPDIKKKISDVYYFPENVFSGKKELRLKLPNVCLEARTSNVKSDSFQFQDQSLVKRKSFAIFTECTSHSSQGSIHASKETANVESHITCINTDAYKNDSEIHKQYEVASYSNGVKKYEQCLSNDSTLHNGKILSVPRIELPTSYEFSTTLKKDSKTFQAVSSFENNCEDSLELLPDSILESSISVNTIYSRKTAVSTYDENSFLIKRTVASEDHLEMSAKKIVSASRISTVNSNLLENSKFLLSSVTSYKHPTNELSKFLHTTPCAKDADLSANLNNRIIKKKLSFVECDLNDSKLQSITKLNFSPTKSSVHADCSESALLNMRTNEKNIEMICTHLVPKVKKIDVLSSVNAVPDVNVTLTTDTKSSLGIKNDSDQEDFQTLSTKFNILLTRFSAGTISSEFELLNTESQANIGKTCNQLASEAKNFELHNSVNTTPDVNVAPITCANEVDLNSSSSEIQNLQLLSTKPTFLPTRPSTNRICSNSEVPDIDVSQLHVGMTGNQSASEAHNFKLYNLSNAIPDDTVDPTSDIDCALLSRNDSELNKEVNDAKIEISDSQFVSEVKKNDTHESNCTVPALAADVDNLTKNPDMERPFRTSIVSSNGSSDAEISCLIKATSSNICNETNLKGNKTEVKKNSSSCIDHNEENERNQQKNKTELRAESNSCASSNEGSYICTVPALATDVDNLTKNPDMQGPFRTSIVSSNGSSDAEISCLIKATSSNICNETNLQGNKTEVEKNSSSCIDHNEENEQNQQKNKTELKAESNSCVSSNEGSYICTVPALAKVDNLTKNPEMQRPFRTSIVSSNGLSDAEISCLIKATSSNICNETNLQGNEIEVKKNSSSCIDHNEENERNQQENKTELRAESNSCTSSNEGNYIDEEKCTALTKKSVENQSLESVDRMKCKLTQFPLAGKRYWMLRALDEKQASFHLTWGNWLYKCQLLILIPCEQSVSNGSQISFHRLDSECRVRNLGHELFLCQKKNTSILPPVNSEKILKVRVSAAYLMFFPNLFLNVIKEFSIS
ncbi:uncharacterized protein LOC118193280 [Stegodyphus dumicola]|uniref:uncharacterized protein LOC118193280 n=1 Tax=Stegodyphus dumicola TaxID=202533 RepID=UPI0015AB3E02|nr:uncharacterized protein LOC118193280 [Stegodyphus dumicola]